MKSYYSTIYAIPNVFASERIAVGLLLISSKQVIYNYSNRKIKFIRKLIPETAATLLEENLEQIKNAVDINNVTFTDELSMDIEKSTDRLFSQSYIDYLSRYSPNLIAFSTPVQVDTKVDEKSFKLLYDRFVGLDESVEKPKYDDVYRAVELSLFKNVKQQFNIKKEITAKHIGSMPYKMNIDLIGKNEVFVSAKVIDFNHSFRTVKGHFDEFTTFKLALDNMQLHNKYFLIGNEPDKKNIKQHHLWRALKNIKYVDYVPYSESDMIEAYAKEHNVKPAFQD